MRCPRKWTHPITAVLLLARIFFSHTRSRALPTSGVLQVSDCGGRPFENGHSEDSRAEPRRHDEQPEPPQKPAQRWQHLASAPVDDEVRRTDAFEEEGQSIPVAGNGGEEGIVLRAAGGGTIRRSGGPSHFHA